MERWGVWGDAENTATAAKWGSHSSSGKVRVVMVLDDASDLPCVMKGGVLTWDNDDDYDYGHLE